MTKEEKRLYDIEYRKNNKLKIAQYKETWYKNNPDMVQDSVIRNKENKKIADKKYATKNKVKLNIKKTEWAKANPVKRTKANRDYVKNKLLIDPVFKLRCYLSTSIKSALKKRKYNKKSKTSDILGCSFDEFKTYLESKFESWMNWENYGNPKDGILELNKTWDIDHIIPMVTAMSEEDVIKLNHHTNLQPLCSYTNRYIKKGINGGY